MEQNRHLEQIEISRIYVLNPRARNTLIAKEIQKNIEDVGLKRPITICKKQTPKNGYEYDLVCGQGRLEAYIANKQTSIPAIVIDATEEETLIMSLVENIARKSYPPVELLKSVKRLRERGYSNVDIAGKIGVTKDYIYQIGTLLDKGEDRLLNAVESKRIPVNVAIDICNTPDGEMQDLLQDAYEKNLIKGNKIGYIKKLLANRKKWGKSVMYKPTCKKMSPTDLNKMYQQEIDRKRLLVRKAAKVDDREQQFLCKICAGHLFSQL